MPRLRWLASLTLVTSLLVAPLGCGLFGEPTPDLASAKTFKDAGLQFEHPGNWETEVEREQLDDLTMTAITVSPKHGDAIVLIQQFQPATAVDDKDQLILDFFQAMRDSTPGMTIRRLDDGVAEVTTQTVFGGEREGRRLRYTIELAGESMPHTVDAVFAELGDRLVIVYTQIADEDRSKVAPAFERILSSLALE